MLFVEKAEDYLNMNHHYLCALRYSFWSNKILEENFIAPLEVIKQAIFMIVNGEIIYYKYDEKEEIIKLKEECSKFPL